MSYGQPIASTRIVVNLRRLNVVFRDFDTETVFVVFCGRSSNPGPDGFWGELCFSRVGVSSIGIVSVVPNSLPDDDLPSALEEIRKLTRGRRVVTFGQGKGAYGALKYSNALHAQAAIAFSPRSFVDGSAVRELHQHPAALRGPDQQNGSSVTADDLSKDIYLFMDPYSKPDVRHTEELLSVARPPSVVHIVRVPFGKQDSLTRISEDGALHELIRQFLPDVAPQGYQLRNVIRAASADSPVHREHLVDLLIKRLHHSSRFLEQYVNFWTPRKALLIGVLLLIRHGQHDRAAIQLDELDDATLALAPTSWMRRYFRLMNFSAGLKRLPPPPEPKAPESVPAQMRAINAWISEGQLDSAITALDHVIQSSGTGPHFKRLL